MHDFEICPITSRDKLQITEILKDAWASTICVSKGKALDATKLPGFLAV